jgi:hypothetical protein
MRYKNLNAEMGRNNVSVSMIAETIDSTYDTARKKVRAGSRFKLGESMKVQKKHFPNLTLEYLFQEFDDGGN